jgi:two-component sensor histidine kinase
MAGTARPKIVKRVSPLDLIGRFVLQGTRSAPWATYLFTLFAVGCAIGLRFGAAMLSPRALLFASFYPAILASTLFGGVGPGLFASALSVLSAWVLFISPNDPFALPTRDQAVNLAFFAAMAALSVFICASYRRLVEQLQKEDIKRSLLASEMQHRNRNALMVTKAIVTQSLRDDRAKADDINQRLAAVYKSSELIVSADDLSVGVESIVALALSAYGPERYSAQGGSIELAPDQARTLALVVHELATNAAKYGALSRSDGKVDISWQAKDGNVEIVWQEHDGPTVRPPQRRGFGSAFLEKMVAGLGGTIAVEFAPTGLVSRIAFPRTATV